MKQTKGEKVFDVFNLVFLSIISVTMLYPFINLIAVSLSSAGPVLSGEVSVIPKGLTLNAYSILLSTSRLVRTFGNTFFITIIGTVIGILMTVIYAYPLSKKKILVSSTILKFVVFTMLFSGGMIPNYILIQKLGLINSLWSIILPYSISAFNLIIVINAFRAVPAELEESCKIDGGNDFQILFKIIVPVTLPTLATIALFYAVGRWNTFFVAVLYLNDMKKYPLQVLLRQIVFLDDAIGGSTDDILNLPPETKKAASIILAVIPILCVYPFLQRYFIKGIMLGSVKG